MQASPLTFHQVLMASYIVLEHDKDSYPALAEGLTVETLKQEKL